MRCIYNNNNNNNKPSSSTAQQPGKPPHCALQNIKNNRDTSISSAAPARQKYRNEEQYKYTFKKTMMDDSVCKGRSLTET